MKGFAKMTKVTWRFYLVALMIMLFFTAVDSLYVCMEDNSVYKGKLFHYGMEQDLEEEFIEKVGGNLENGKDITHIYCDKVNDYALFGYYPMLFVLVVIMLLKQCIFMDVRTAEFQRTFPVKQRVQVLHDYFSVLCIMVLSALLQLGIFLAYQTSFNTEMLKTAKMFSIASGSYEIISHANAYLLRVWGMYFLYMAVAYTWVYVGVLLAKNPIAGAILSVFVHLGVYECFRYRIWKWVYVMWNMDIDMSNWIRDIVDYISYPDAAFGRYGGALIAGNAQMILIAVCGLLGIMIFLICFMFFVSTRRELSRGKVLYFPILDYPLCFMIGIFFISTWEEPVYLVVVVISFLLIHPWSHGKRNVLEVK